MSSSSPSFSAAGVQVVVRLRPLNDKEKKHGTLPVVSASTNEKTVTVVKGNTASKRQRCCYKFDNVFTAFSTQQEVFQATLHPIIKDVMNGYESTVFAYGQTGTGKTHTMEGNLKSSEEYGIIPRSAEAIFEELENKPEKYQSYNVKCSYLEIYNEELCDLLLGGSDEQKQRKQQYAATKPTKLQIVEGKNGPYCNGLSCQNVSNASEVLNLIRRADQQRQVSETKMNKQSSRSHCIFTISVNATKQCCSGEGSNSLLEIQGKLHLVDLAGSECAKNANMDGTPSKHQAARERERMNINRSLLTLGRVVSMLKEQSTSTAGGGGGGGGKKSSSSANAMRIPYRDSKLTRILQESLGGRCKTCIIATLSPSVMAVEESISTLNYAQAANGIINKPISTSYMSSMSSTQSTTSSTAMPNSSKGGNSGEGGIGSVEHWQEMELRLEYMQVQVDEAKGALARKHLEQQQLVEQAETAEMARQQMEDQYNAALLETAAMKQQHANEVAAHQTTQYKLRQTIAILNATQNTEVCLTKEANALIDALKKSIDDGNNLHHMIVENQQADLNRKQATKQFNSSAQTMLENVVVSLNELSESETRYRKQLNHMAVDGENHHLEFAAKVFETICSTSNKVKTTAQALQLHVHGTNGDEENDDSTAGTGLLASSKAVASGVTEGVTNVKHSIEEGEDTLQQGFDACKEQLSDYGIKLNKLESIHSESCQKTLRELDQNVSTSKGKLLNLVSSATTALEEAKLERMKVQNAVTHILQQWKTSTTDSARQIENQSTTQQTAVTEMLDTMNTEMKRYDDMESYLSSQKLMLQNVGADHALDLKTQGELLISHKNALVTSQQQHKEVCEQVVENVMTGIQDLVQKQMATIVETQKNNFTALIDTNLGLIEKNTGSYNRFNNDIVRDVDSTNENLRNEVQAIRRTDRSVAGLLENTGSVLDTIKQTSVDQIASVHKYAAKAIKGMQDINQLEASSSTKIKEKLGSDREQCAKHLQQVLHQSTKEGITTVADTGNDVISFTCDGVLAPMSTTINAMEEPRPGMMATLNEKCDTIRTTVQQGYSEIEQTAQNVSKATEEMEIAVIAKENDFINTAEAHKTSIGKYKEDLTEYATKHCGATTTALSDTMAKSTNAKDAVGDYAMNVIRINEEVGPAPDRNVIEYNAKLSATPLDHIILKNLEEEDENNIDKPSPGEEDPEVAIATTTCNDENIEVNISTESMVSVSSPINRKATTTMTPGHQQGGKRMNSTSVSSPRNKNFAAAESKIPTHHKRMVQRGGTPVVKKRTKR